ncbi:MAG: Holliday junction resolvase RuvX [Candidatus Comchoanobacterales bacterium]
MMNPSVVIGIDFGSKQMGLAVGDVVFETIQPLGVIKTSEDSMWPALDEVVVKWAPDAWVLGLPLDTSGNDQKITKLVRLFAQQLKQRYDREVHLVDERWSSAEARSRLSDKRARKKKIDMMSAVVILEQWLGAPR